MPRSLQGYIMPRTLQGYIASWLCSLVVVMVAKQHVALASVTAEPLIGLASATLQEVRQLQQNVTPDCGLAFQPCCAGGDSCLDGELTCIAREPVALCEPCGTPFTQPCPQSPYCEALELIPTTRRSNAVIQCRPCGQEWQPCCAVLDTLCGDGFMCYAEQDRCVVPEYADVKEEFFPDLVSQAMSTSPICGGLNDPPCMEPSIAGPTWQCDKDLTTFVPVFLCMEATVSNRQAPAVCGAEDQEPCTNGCQDGLTSVVVLETDEALCLKTFSLTSDSQGSPDTIEPDETEPVTPLEPTEPTSLPEPAESSTPTLGETAGECGGFDQPICQDGEECSCGLMAGDDGSCVEDPAGCLIPTRDVDRVVDQSGPRVLDQSATEEQCGILGAKPCSKPLVQPCACQLYLDPETGLCKSEISSGGRCPQRPYCGYDGGEPCDFPRERPCDECNEVDKSIFAVCVRNPGCTPAVEKAVDDKDVDEDQSVEDQSAVGQTVKCGGRDQIPCPITPFCKDRLVPTEEGKCKRCGLGAGSMPCNTFPYCKGQLVSAIDGVQLEVCEACGGEGNPPCLHEDTGRHRPGQAPCQKGLKRTTVNGSNMALVSGQGSFCTSATLPGQCGYVGQNSCNGECMGRSTASEDGMQCIECGGPGQGTCDGPRQEECDAGLISFPQDSLAPICVCPLGGCNTALDDCLGDEVIDQSGGGDDDDDTEDITDEYDEDVSSDCGDIGQPRCTFADGPECESRLLADEDGICVPCGDSPGDVPCDLLSDPPRCGSGLVLKNDFCELCGGSNEPVCCDEEQCSEDSEDTVCEEGLFLQYLSSIGSDLVRTVTAEAYCSLIDSGENCGQIGQAPCTTQDEDPESDLKKPCIGLSVPSLDRTQCVPCGRAGQLPCWDREHAKFCTGQLITVFDAESRPIYCFEPNMDPDAVVDQSGSGDCGQPGMPACDEASCFGRSILQEHGKSYTCIPCGGAEQPVCTSAEPCDGTLRLDGSRCRACGGLGEPVCPRSRIGPPCNNDLESSDGTCEPASPAEEEVVDQNFEECGSEGTVPCPGQPACGDLLFLVEEDGVPKCSSTQPAVDYPSGENCGGDGQLVCNAAPQCSENLFASYPEGVCLPSVATTLACGTLGNSPCEIGRRCEAGLAVRSGICAPSLSQPCGIRGFPVCLGRSNLCHQLLSPSFPSMLCIDSSRSDEKPCGVLATSACLDLDCASGLVVHPDTKVCVPPADEPCGAARQTQCFWNGDASCQEGLEPKGGICAQAVS